MTAAGFLLLVLAAAVLVAAGTANTYFFLNRKTAKLVLITVGFLAVSGVLLLLAGVTSILWMIAP